MRYIFITIALMLATSLWSQTEETKTVRIKKVIEKNGETTTEVIEASGAEADKILQEMRENGELENIDIESTGDKKVRIIKKDKDDKSTVTKSTERSMEVEKTVDDNGTVTSSYILTEMSDGKKKVIKWDGEGEPPAEMKAVLEETEVKTIIVDEDINSGGKSSTIEKCVTIEKKMESPNKARLGVMVKDEGNGVVIEGFAEGAAIKYSGLKVGDTILKINKENIFSIDGLLSYLSKFEPGNAVSIKYLRAGEESWTKAVLEASK